MRNKLLASLTIIIILFVSSCTYYESLQLHSITPTTKNNIISSIQDQGDIQVYFCPHEDCETALVSFISSAQQSIHCALYDIGLASIQQILLEKSKVIDVRVVTDSDYLKKFNYSFVKQDSYGLMHNKFCVIDGVKVSGGSMNPTNNDAHKNNNNLLLINSKLLAQNYEDEFEEMWNGTFKKGDLVKNPQISIGNISLENYFCPDDQCADHVKEELKKARKSIHFMTFSFTHKGIANIILLRHLEGVEVKGVMEVKQISKYSVYNTLNYQLETVLKDGNKYNLHHKVFIIDGETVVTGSFNPTDGGDKRNDENILIIHDTEIAGKYETEFEYVWDVADKAIKNSTTVNSTVSTD